MENENEVTISTHNGSQVARQHNLRNPKVVDMMGRLSFVVDEELDKQFPTRRICRAEIITRDGRHFLSDECEPRGEAHENISVAWLQDKFRRITGPVFCFRADTWRAV